MTKEILFFILMLCCYVECPGQTLFGKVADQKGNPIPYANVVLLSPLDSSFVKGTVSNKNGLFSLDKIPFSKGILKDRLTFNIQINDIFNSYRNSNQLHYGDRDIYKWNRSDSRQLLLTVRYKFNSAKSKYKGTGAGNEEKSRL